MFAEYGEYRREEEQAQGVPAQEDEGAVYHLAQIWLECEAQSDDEADDKHAAHRIGVKGRGIGDEQQQCKERKRCTYQHSPRLLNSGSGVNDGIYCAVSDDDACQKIE